MLSISLPRGFGLLILVLPTYRAPRKTSRQPLALPAVKGDLLADARELLASGHAMAAAMTARVELERLLTKIAMEHPSYGGHWLGVRPTADWLRDAGVIGVRCRHATVVAADVGNRAAHCGAVSRSEVGSMFNAIASLRSALERT